MKRRRPIRALIVTTMVVGSISVAPIRAARTFDLTTASISDINAAFDAGALTSERLTQLYLARIAAYDKTGPKPNAVLKINPNAVAEARALDAERRTEGPRERFEY